MNSKVLPFVIFVLSLSILVLGWTAVGTFAQTAKELDEEIDGYVQASVSNRDYPSILARAKELCEKFPESKRSISMLERIRQWHKIGEISAEQFSPFKVIYFQQKQVYDQSKAIAGKLQKQYEYFMATGKNPERIIQECNNILDKPEIPKSLRCMVYMFLAQIYFKTKQFDQYQKSIDYLYSQEKFPDGLDFPGGKSLIDEIKILDVKKKIEDVGIDEVLLTWKQTLADAETLESVIIQFNVVYGFLKDALKKSDNERDAVKYDQIAGDMIGFLEGFIQKFSDSTERIVIEMRMNLGKMVLNRVSFRPGILSGVMTIERSNEVKAMERLCAEKAKPIFLKVCELGKGTMYEKNARHFLEVAECRINTTLTPVEEDYVAPPITISNSFSYRFWSTLIFSVLLLLFFFRDSMRHFCLSLFSKFKKK